MPAARKLRLVALVGLAALLIGAGCNRGDDTDDDVDVTEAPSPTPSVEAISDFQVVGRIDESFVGEEPPVDVTDVDLDVADASPSPEPTPVGAPAPQEGVMRIQIEALNDDLKSNCGLDVEDFVNVYWSNDTYFEPASILEGFEDFEDRIEERTTGVTGVIVGGPDDDDEALETLEPTLDATAEASPTGSPDADATAQDSDCVLVAEQVGFTTPRLPTPRPAVRTAAPAPVRTATPAPTRVVTPTPVETEEPEESPEESPDESPEASP